jgi:hypothetical protein
MDRFQPKTKRMQLVGTGNIGHSCYPFDTNRAVPSSVSVLVRFANIDVGRLLIAVLIPVATVESVPELTV